MTSKFAISAATAMSVALWAGSSCAADLGNPRYTKSPVAISAVTYNWTGCYGGANVGGGIARTSQRQIAKVGGGPIVPNNNFGSGDDTSVIGGLQVGCDYQFDANWVVGVQGKFDFGDIESRHTVTAFPTFYSKDKTNQIFTATARAGYLVTPAVLAYLKGGAAWAHTKGSFYGTVPANFLSESASSDRTGWTLGAGVEWMFAPGWSVFGEYSYMDFGRRHVNYAAAPGTFGLPDVVSTRLTIQTVLVGVNYKFNWSAPIVAKY